MGLLGTLLNNPVVSYYRNLAANRRVSSRGRGIDIHPAASVIESALADYVKVGSRSILYRARVGAYSYVAQDARINVLTCGKFCSIGPHVRAGYGRHPVDWVSTHPVFYSNAGQCGARFRHDSIFVESLETILGNDVWIGTGAVLMDGIKVEDGAIVGAGAIVTADVPAYSIVAGVPARILRTRATSSEIEAMKALAWWDWPEEKLRENLQWFAGPISAFVGHFGRRPHGVAGAEVDEVAA